MNNGKEPPEFVAEFRRAVAAIDKHHGGFISAIDFYRACRAIEMMVVTVCQDQGEDPEKRRMSFGMMVSFLAKADIFPKHLLPSLISIVQQRNMVAHSPDMHLRMEPGDFVAFLVSAQEVLVWYLTSYEGGPALDRAATVALLVARPRYGPPEGRKAFLCYAKEDFERVSEIYDHLKKRRHLPWMDKRDLLPGQDWEYEIRNVIRKADFFIACMSKTSVGKRGYVQKEIRFALDVLGEIPAGQIYLIPVRLEPCDVPPALKGLHWLDLDSEDSYDKLFAALEMER